MKRELQPGDWVEFNNGNKLGFVVEVRDDGTFIVEHSCTETSSVRTPFRREQLDFIIGLDSMKGKSA